MRYFLTVLFFFLSCSTQPPGNISGCTNSAACNFNVNANEDDGSCIQEADKCGVCDNDPDNDCIQDCAGIWGGNTPASYCENCISNSGEFDCSGNCCINHLIYSLDSLIYTDISCSIEDLCGVCDGDNSCADGLSYDDISIILQIINANDFSTQQSALNETAFHSWDNNTNGSIEFTEFGIQIWSGGRLQYLNVENISIILTDDIGGLTELTELILFHNGLTEIPETIGNLQKLNILNITSNPISLLPARIIELTNLEKLDISKNNILYLPENIGNLTKLTRLNASGNMLITLPESIGSLNQLTDLFLGYNQIDSLPTSFSDLSSLVELSLYNNKLEILPDSFGAFGKLIFLYLNNNQLNVLPDNFGNMSNLQILYLNNNNLTSLPESIGNLDSLEELWLQNNEFVILSDEIGSLSSLEKLRLNDNKLEMLPDSLCNIYSGLVEFSVGKNYLCSSPDCIIYTNLEDQYCQTNSCPPFHFTPIEDFCVFIEDYTILQEFLDLNPFSQSLPSQSGIPNSASEVVNEDWWHLDNNTGETRLVEISFQSKQLKSTIPENIGNLAKLEILRLSDNKLTGEIPDNITNLNNLKILELNSNQLSGTIPSNIGALSKLDTLYLSYNNLTGEIPSSITEIDSIKYLALNDNYLTGPIPDNIGSLDSLKYLYIDYNQLTGEIPQSLGNLGNIQRIYLHTNQLSGLIPENLCNIYDNYEYARLMLDHNRLCPPYPECIPEHHIGPQYTSGCGEP